MSRALAIAAALAVATAAPLATAPAGRAATVQAMVVGKSKVLRGPRAVKLRRRSVQVGHRRCTVGSDTPLSVLAGMRLKLRVRDDGGGCGRRRLADSALLFVTRVGPDRNGGRDGWVYKVGHRTGTTGAADPSGPFGNGRRLRAGQRVLWFWCVLATTGCQRSLDVVPASSTAAPDAPVRLTVSGYDDAGHGVPVAGATVRLGGVSSSTGPDGVAVVPAPATPGSYRASATAAGMVPAFPATVRVQ